MKYFNCITLPLLFISILTACSSVTNEDTSSESVKAISDDIIAMTDVQNKQTKNVETAEQTVTVSQATISQSSVGEQFFAQQAKIQAELPVAITTKYQLAITAMKSKQWHEANDLLDQVIELKPELSGPYLNKALIAIKQNDLATAQAYVNQGYQVNAINPMGFNLQGIIAREQGQFELAEQSYLQALAIWPDYAQAHLNLAVLLELYRGKLALAKKHYLAYLALQPDDVQAQRWLAALEIKLAAE